MFVLLFSTIFFSCLRIRNSVKIIQQIEMDFFWKFFSRLVCKQGGDRAIVLVVVTGRKRCMEIDISKRSK